MLSTSVFYRNKILENINELNDKLGDMLRNKQTVSNEVILNKISKKFTFAFHNKMGSFRISYSWFFTQCSVWL